MSLTSARVQWLLLLATVLASLFIWRANMPVKFSVAGRPLCTWQGKLYSGNAIVQTEDGVLSCRDGRWERKRRKKP